MTGYTQLVVPQLTVTPSSTIGPDLRLVANNATLSGVVRDRGTGLGVGGVLVALIDASGHGMVEVRSEAEGAYTLSAVARTYVGLGAIQNGGGYAVRVRAFEPFTLEAGGSSTDIALPTLTIIGSPCTTVMCQISVSGAGFTANSDTLVSIGPNSDGTYPSPSADHTAVADTQGNFALAWPFSAKPGSYEIVAVQGGGHGSAVVVPSLAYVVQAPIASPTPIPTPAPILIRGVGRSVKGQPRPPTP
jgi:hypothetical protein